MKTRNIWKFLLIATALISLSACRFSLGFNRTADMAKQMAAEIADFTLPKGFKAVFSGTYNEYTLVAYNSTDNDHSHLYLVQSTDPEDLATFQRELEELMPAQIQTGSDFTVVETSDLVVRDADAVMIITEGLNGDQQEYRQMIVFFEGKNGPAAMVFSELFSDWDDARAEALVASID